MNEFEYKYRCDCNDEINSITFGLQEDDSIKSKIDIEKMDCPICKKKMKYIKTVQTTKNDKKVEKEIGTA